MPMLTLAVQFFLGLLYADAGEWLMHKYIPQALGNKPYSFQAYHLYEHHAVCASKVTRKKYPPQIFIRTAFKTDVSYRDNFTHQN